MRLSAWRCATVSLQAGRLQSGPLQADPVSWLVGRGVIVMLAVLLAVGCAQPPPPAAPPPPKPVVEPPPPAEPEPEPEPVPSAPGAIEHRCGQDKAAEAPIVVGTMGEGERLVRLINNSTEHVQARLLDEQRKVVYQGTLQVAPGAIGEFHVPAGVYMLRYRRQKTCEVMRGAKLVLKGRNAGVEISIKPNFDAGSQSKMKPVGEDL